MKRGFTLVEMVLVMVIVSILAQLTNVMIKTRRENAIVDVLTEYIQIFVGAMRMYYYNHNGDFPLDFKDGVELKTVSSLKPYLPRSFSNFKIIENCKVTAYVNQKTDENTEQTESKTKELVGYGIVVTGINNEKLLEKLKDQLLLEVNMKDSTTEANRKVLMDLIQIVPKSGKFIFYLKTTDKNYL